MLRSFLARPHPLISNLRRHDHRPLVRQLGRRTDQIISRSYTSDEDETDSDFDLPEARNKQKHLYVVLDDWKKGFSIHKLDMDDGSDGGDLTLQAPVHRQSTGGHQTRYWNFAALGSKIVAAGRIKYNEDDYVTLVYDTEAAGLSIVSRLPAALHGHWYLAVAAGNGLYTFETSDRALSRNGVMHLLEDAPAPAVRYKKYWWGTSDHWSWSTIPTPPPFNVFGVESSAVHPVGGGRILFVSVGEWNDIEDMEDDIMDNWDPWVGRVIADDDNIRTSQTFSYDTVTGEWSRHGDWDLPFRGQAHYNEELDVWVGLQKIYEPDDNHATDGYLCSCDVASPDGSPVQPAWKLCTERLFDPHTESHVGANLVYMGDSNYCLVEVMTRERFKRRRCVNVGNKCVIRVARFRLKYGKKGELIVTDRKPDRSYLFSKFYEHFEVQAFWM